MNQRISLYLSGQYPNNYRIPNRFDVILKIRQLDGVNFNDTMLGLLQGKGDSEFFNTLLESFQSLHNNEEYEKLLNNLEIPDIVRKDPYTEIKSTNIDLQKIDEFLKKASEEEFSRFIVMPILHAMGYEDVEYKGKVNESDHGIDFYVIKYKSPIGLEYYCGVQTKSCKLTNGTTSKPGAELTKLIQETNSAFLNSQTTNNGKEVFISELIIFNSYDVPESAKETFFKSKDIKDKKITFYGKDGVLSLISKLTFDKDFFSNLE